MQLVQVERAEKDRRRDERLGSLLGRLRFENRITEPEYQAGLKWHKTYWAWIKSIQEPDECGDEYCEIAKASYLRGLAVLESAIPGKKRTRVVHAVNAVAVFEEPEELGEFEYTLRAARVGLSDLAAKF